MRSRLVFAASIAGTAIVSSGLTAYVMNQAPKAEGTSQSAEVKGTSPAEVKSTEPASLPIQQVTGLAEMPGAVVPTYTVKPEPVRGNVRPRTADQEGRLKVAAGIVSLFQPIPPDRIQFFGWLNEPPHKFTVRGWSIFVTDVNPFPGGWTITLTVWPKIGQMQVSTAFVEHYLWSDGVLTFVNGTEPPIFKGRSIGMF